MKDSADSWLHLPVGLQRITIANYRSCLKTKFDLHPNLSVLIGPNGSGKTNILQALMLLHRLASDDRLRFHNKISGNTAIGATFRQGTTSAHLRSTIDTQTNESNSDVIRGSRQNWTVRASTEQRARFHLPLSLANRRPYVYAGGRLRELLGAAPEWGQLAVSRISNFCRGLKYYSASQFTNPSSCPVSFEIEGDGNTRRPISLQGHERLLFAMYLASKDEATENYQRFLDIVGRNGLGLIGGLSFREVPTSSVDHAVRVGGKVEVRRRSKLLIVPQFQIGAQKFSPNQLSEGTFKTLALVFHIATSESSTLLIEEPEVCVHHGLLASILEIIKDHSRRSQVVVSTHSDYVLDHVSPENVYRVAKGKSLGTQVFHITKTMRRRELSALRLYLEQEGNLGEFWREGGLGDRQ